MKVIYFKIKLESILEIRGRLRLLKRINFMRNVSINLFNFQFQKRRFADFVKFVFVLIVNKLLEKIIFNFSIAKVKFQVRRSVGVMVSIIKGFYVRILFIDSVLYFRIRFIFIFSVFSNNVQNILLNEVNVILLKMFKLIIFIILIFMRYL